MTDYCVRGVTADGSIRYKAAATTGLCEEARKRHDTWPVVTAALGRLLTAASFFGLNLKGDDTVTLRVEGGGPTGVLLAVAQADGKVRGYVQEPHVDLERDVPGKLPVGKAVGDEGYLYVIKDLGLKEPYTGSVQLLSGEIGDDVACYLLESEQVPAAVALGVLVNPDGSVGAAGGYMIELLPGATEEAAQRLEENIMSLPKVSQMLESGLTPEEIISKVLAGLELEELERVPLQFQCTCSRQRLAGVLVSLGKEELERLIQEGEGAEAVCRFCGEAYRFSQQELEQLYEQAK